MQNVLYWTNIDNTDPATRQISLSEQQDMYLLTKNHFHQTIDGKTVIIPI